MAKKPPSKEALKGGAANGSDSLPRALSQLRSSEEEGFSGAPSNGCEGSDVPPSLLASLNLLLKQKTVVKLNDPARD